jgi:CheY-like chemotaxis protein
VNRATVRAADVAIEGNAPASGVDVLPQIGVALVVDDEVAVRRTTERILRRLGFAVVSAESGAEAVALFRARQAEIALVVTDLAMPGMDGLEVGRAIRALSAGVPMIVVTGHGEQRDLRGLFQAALAKPFTVDELGQVVRAVVPA